MIMIKKEQVLNFVKTELDYDLNNSMLTINDEDDLHDYIATLVIGGYYIEEYDYLYYTITSLIPEILPDILSYIMDGMEYGIVMEEQNRVYYSMII